MYMMDGMGKRVYDIIVRAWIGFIRIILTRLNII
jgi:hypothetical protein